MAFPTGWARRCSLVISNTAVSADITDFPWLFTRANLPQEMFDADGSYHALEGGGDVIFTSDASGNTRLSIEVVSFHIDNDPSNGYAEIWVKVPQISSATGATVYVWYGKSGESQPARDAAYGSESVWTYGYRGVYHFNQQPPTTLNDSSAYEHHATASGFEGNECINGLYGKAMSPSGGSSVNEYYTVADAASLEPTTVSLECVIRWPKQLGDYAKIIHKGTGASSPYGSWCLQHEGTVGYGNQNISIQIGRSDGTRKSSTGNILSIDTWYSVIGRTYENARYTQIFTNGVSRDFDDHGSGNFLYDSKGLGIFATGDVAGSSWRGIIEELRFGSAERGSDYAQAFHSTQFGISTYTTPGTPETMSATIAPSSIASSEAWGTLEVNLQIQVGSITSSEAWGTLLVDMNIDAGSIVSSEAWSNDIQVEMQIQVGSIVPPETQWGYPSVNSQIVAGSIISGESFDNPQVDMQVQVGSIASSESWGTPILSTGVQLLVSSIPSSASFGTTQIDMQIRVDGILSSESWGDTQVEFQVALSSIPSSETWGTVQVNQQIQLDSIPSSEAWDNPHIIISSHIFVQSIQSSEAWGTPSISGPQAIFVDSILSSELWGSPVIIRDLQVLVQSIPSSERWGDLQVIIEQFIIIDPGIVSSESWGIPHVSLPYVSSFKRMMEQDLDEGFFNDEEFAMPITITYADGYTHQIKAIFDNEYMSIDADTGAPVMSRNPVIWMQESKYKRQYTQGCHVRINGVTYRCMEPQPDGTGLLVLELHHQKVV
jgi:hypothetical protein